LDCLGRAAKTTAERVTRTGLRAQGCKNRSVRIGLLGQGSQGRTERTEKPTWISGTGQPERDSQNRASKTEQAEQNPPAQDHQDSNTRAGQADQDSQVRTSCLSSYAPPLSLSRCLCAKSFYCYNEKIKLIRQGQFNCYEDAETGFILFS
jgi:hypothetical protein